MQASVQLQCLISAAATHCVLIHTESTTGAWPLYLLKEMYRRLYEGLNDHQEKIAGKANHDSICVARS